MDPIVVESMKSDVFKVHIFLTKPCKSAAKTCIFFGQYNDYFDTSFSECTNA